MNRYKKIYTLWIVLCSGIISCIDPIDFETGRPQGTLVIEGQLTTSPSNNFFYLSQVAEFGTFHRVPLTGASARIVDETGQTFAFTETETGFYTLSDPSWLAGIPGKKYHLELTLPNGQIWRTDPEAMPEPLPIDSVSLTVSHLSNGQVDIYASATFPDRDTWLRYQVVENYAFSEKTWSIFISSKTCYFELPALTPFRQFTNFNNSATKLERILVGTKKELGSREFSRGRHYFNVHQFSTTEGSYQYYDQLGKLLSLNGSVFDAPPAAVPGNMYRLEDPADRALGYFEMASVDTMRTFTYPTLINAAFYLPDYCSPEWNYYYPVMPEECCDCLLLPGASLIKPYWWE